MPRTPVPFPTITAPNSKAENGGELVNCYLEKLEDGRIARRRVPGLEQIATTPTYLICRGMIEVNGELLVVRGTRLQKITKSGSTYTVTDLGTLGGTGPVFFGRNNKTPTPDIAAVSDSSAFSISTSSAPVAYPDADVQSPNSVCGISGYLIFSYGDGRMRSTGLNSTAIATTDEATAETRPDGLTRVIQYGRDIIAFGPKSIEFWANTGEPVGFPLSYRETLDVGIAAATAVAGHDDGFIGKVIFVGSDNRVYALNGYQRERISTHALERHIETLSSDDRGNLRAQVYMHSGHACWALTSTEWTWVYDVTTGSWFERESYGGVNWTAAYSANAFGEWLMGDATTGQVYKISETYRYEGPSTPLVMRARSATMSPFPTRGFWRGIDVDIMAGVGITSGADPIQTNPTATIRISRDGGVSWPMSYTRTIGKQGEYGRNVRLRALGQISQRGAQVEVIVSDPVECSLFGATADFAPATS